MAAVPASQFWVLCFGLPTAPQVFPRALAPLSAIHHCRGFCFSSLPHLFVGFGFITRGFVLGGSIYFLLVLCCPGLLSPSLDIVPLSLFLLVSSASRIPVFSGPSCYSLMESPQAVVFSVSPCSGFPGPSWCPVLHLSSSLLASPPAFLLQV